jgi:hypothetical protein
MENSFPFCKPESNPPEFPSTGAKYTQGLPNWPCVTELKTDPLHIHEHRKGDDRGKFVRGEKERHSGAVRCREGGRVIGGLTIRAHLTLRMMSTKIDTKD